MEPILAFELADKEFEAARNAATLREKRYHLDRAMEVQPPLYEVLARSLEMGREAKP